MLRLLIFLPLFLFSQESFLLPDDADHLMDTIYTEIDKTEKELFVFTSFLDDYMLIKHLKKLAKRGIPITIITKEPIEKDSQLLRLTLLKNISIATLKPFGDSDDSRGSLICIDDAKLFLLSDQLDSKVLKSRYSFGLSQEHPCNMTFRLLQQRSVSY